MHKNTAKKAITLFLAIALALSLAACGGNVKKVEKAIPGEWGYTFSSALASGYSYYNFGEGGSVSFSRVGGDSFDNIKTGYYEVTKDGITVSFVSITYLNSSSNPSDWTQTIYDEPRVETLTYTYKSGTLSLSSDTNELTKMD